MRKIILPILAFLFINLSFGQEIKMGINLLGYKFEQNGKRLSWKELESETKSNIEANILIKKAKSQNLISNILAFSSGGLIGIPIGQSITDREPNWNLAYLGGGLVMIGIPIAIMASKNVKKGIELYNSSLNSTSLYKFKPEFKLIANDNGIGLEINF